MATSLVISQRQDVTVVDFRNATIIDSVVIQGIGDALYELIDKQAARRVILDFSAVRFLSSQMLGVLIAMHKKSAAIKGRIVLVGLREELKKVFHIMRLDDSFLFAPDEQAAMEKLGA